MKYLKIFLLLNLILLISNCGTAKKAFTNQKKSSTDEFLVEKKSPLVMPPNFNDLPVPNQNEEISQMNQNKIKDLVTKNETENSEVNTSDENNTNIEQSILKKIKK